MKRTRSGAALLVLLTVLHGCGGSRGPDTNRGISVHSNRDLVATAGGEQSTYGRSYAVVIGIEGYQHVKTLKYAEDDAVAVKNALERHGFEVTSILGAEATLPRIRQVLGTDLLRKLQPDDRVLIYFSGHGDDTREGAGAAIGYLVPVEAEAESLRAMSLQMSELQSWIEDYPAKHVMFVADACYSGLALQTKSIGMPAGMPHYIRQVMNARVRFSLVAGGPDEEAVEDDYFGHGVFTHYFLEALSKADSDANGAITSLEIASYVTPRVSNYVTERRGHSDGPQGPSYQRNGKGEFVFFPSDVDGPRAAAVEGIAGSTAVAAPDPRPRGPAPAPTYQWPKLPELQSSPPLDDQPRDGGSPGVVVVGALAGSGAAAVLGVVAWIVREDYAQEFNDHDGGACGKRADARGGAGCDELYETVEDWTDIRTVGFVGAGVLAATAAAFYLADRSSETSSSSAACAPDPLARGIACAGRF